MAVQNNCHPLSSIVRMPNSPELSPPARLRSLSSFLAKKLKCSVTFYLLDNDRQHLTSRISSFGPGKAVNCMIPVGEGIVGLSAADKAFLKRDVHSCHPGEVFKRDEREIAAFPILAGDFLLGVAALGFTHCTSLSSDDLQLLEDFFGVAAGIIEGMQAAAISERRSNHFAVLGDLGRLLNNSVSPHEMVSHLLQFCCDQGGASCTIIRLAPDQAVLHEIFKKIQGNVRSHVSKFRDMEASFSAQVMDSGMALFPEDLGGSTGSLPFICMPLRFDGKSLGTLTVFSRWEKSQGWRTYDAEDRRLFASMAVLISNALAGSANYQQVVRLGEANDTKLKELALLYRVSNAMLSTIRLNKLIHLILTVLTSGTNPIFDRAMLFLINKRAGVMQGMLGVDSSTTADLLNPGSKDQGIPSGRWDIPDEDMARQRESELSRQVRASRLPLNKSLNVASRAVLEKRLIYVSDAENDRRVDRDFVRRFGITSFATAPLMAKDEVVGVVVVDNPMRGKQMSQDDLSFVQLFMNQAGMAIENSMLYNRLEDANRSLREAQELLIQGERLATIGEMAASIAHELKGPLVSIGGFARRLGKKLPPRTAEWEYAETIIGEVKRLEKMLTDILSFSRKATICYAHCNITDIIEEALAIVTPALEEGGIQIHKKFPARIISFLGDSHQLKQVFINLFLNAQEAMKEGGQLELSVSSAKLNGKNAVSIKVADTGGGIATETLNNVFNPFFTTKETGTGLGLPIANRIVTNHGGKLHLHNRPGIGVEFTVLLPLQN